MCKATDQWQTTPGDKILMSTETSCHLDHLLQVKKKSVWFYTIFFMILYMYITPGQGLTTPWGQNFDVNRNLLSLQSYVASFKKSLWSLILYNKCSLAGADRPLGTKFWCQQICLVISFICCKFKKISLKSDVIQFFFSWFNTCSPGAGAERPQGTKFWWQQKGLITFPICCKFQRNLFEVWFYTIVFMI